MTDRPDFGDFGRYGWVFELIDARPGVRAGALARHRSLMGAALADGRSGTLVDLLSAFIRYSYDADAVDPRTYGLLAGYGVLFLQWELRFPAEWRGGWPYSPWSAKEAVLETFCVRGPTPQTGPALADLLIAAVSRVQRGQDRWYWRLAAVSCPPSCAPAWRPSLEAGASRPGFAHDLCCGFLTIQTRGPAARRGGAGYAWKGTR
jgi:hypothetical protein